MYMSFINTPMYQNMNSNQTKKWRPAGLFPTHRPAAAVSSPAFLVFRPIGFFALLLLISLAFLAFLLLFTDPTIRLQQRNNNPVGLPFSEPVSSPPSSVDCAGVLGQSDKVSFPYYRDWKFGLGSHLGPKICIVSTTSAGLDQILPWIFYHKVIGVARFFLFVEGKAASPAVYSVLHSIPGVRLIRRTRELVEQQANSRIWNETWLSPFFYKPCNYVLFVKQTLNMEMAIVMATEAGMDWIIHVDTDELIHPVGSSEYSVQKLLSDVPRDVDLVIFPNHESIVERDDIREPFSEVSMFKKNYDHVPRDVYFGNYMEATHGNPNYFLAYGNGKSAARLQHHLRPNGAHRWHNYYKIPKEISFNEAAVLHYTYAKFSDLTSRRDRCGCKLTKEDIERCFMLDFDRAAFVIASTGTEEELRHWYRDHVVWDDRELNSKLLKEGVLTRIHTPMVIIQSLRESQLFSFVITASMSSGGTNPSTSTENNTYSKTINDQTRSQNVLEFPATPPQAPPTPLV